MCSSCSTAARQTPTATVAATAATAAAAVAAPPALTPLNFQPTRFQQRLFMVLLAETVHCDVAAIAACLDVCQRTVEHWLTRWREERCLADLPRSGRPRVTNEDEDAAILALAELEHDLQPEEIREELGLADVSRRTIRRRLNEHGLFSCVPRVEHMYSEPHLQRRLEFCQKYGVWTHDVWQRVIFIDETSFVLHGSHHHYIQRRKGEAWNPERMKQAKTHGQRLNAWACFSANGVGHIELFTENLNKERMLQILETHLLASAQEMHLLFNFFFIEQDNDPKHRSKIVQAWLREKKIEQLPLPPYSPDLNPIENVFSIWKHRVYNRHPQDLQQLRTAVQEEWQRLPQRTLQNLVKSMPERCQKIQNNAGHRVGF